MLADEKVLLTSETGEFTFTLNHEEEVREKVDVTVPDNRIETTATQSTETLSAQEITDLPVPSSHNLAQSLIAMPQVMMDNAGLLHIAGRAIPRCNTCWTVWKWATRRATGRLRR